MNYPVSLLACVAMAGCHSDQRVQFVPPHSAQLATTCEDSSAGPNRPGVAGSLRQSETIKVYGVNRYIDAGDPRVMHERHAIYRLEQQPAWVTRSPRSHSEIILGPVVGLRKPEYAPDPLPGETARELFQARRGIQEANDGVKDLRENQEKLAGSVASFAKETTDAQRKLTVILSALNQRVKRLEGDNAAAGGEQTDETATRAGDGDVVVRSPSP
jgi:hypothetical protein